MQKLKHLKQKLTFKLKIFFVAFWYAFRHPKRFFRAVRESLLTFNVRSVLTLNVWKKAAKWCWATLPRRIVSSILIVLFIVAPIQFLFFRNVAKAAWWDDNWAYRQKISLTNSTGADLTDFQVSMTVDTASLITAGKMTGTCSDMRFTSNNGQQLDYWIEENNPGCGNAATKIWIKVPKVFNGTNATSIYMYYGNSSATASQNGSDVFPFFDDFNNSALDVSKWTATGSYSISGGALTTTTGAVYTKNTATDGAQNYVYETRRKWTGTGVSYSGLNIANTQRTYGSNSPARKLVYFDTSMSNSLVAAFGADGSVSSYNIVSGTNQYNATFDNYYVDGFSVDASYVRFYHNRSQTNPYAGTWTDAPYLWLGYFLGSGSGTADITDLVTDWVLVRKYASTDPTTSAGSEETGPGPIAYWRFDEGQGTTAEDATVNNNDGAISGATWKPESECVSGKCLSFDGTNDVVTVASTANNIQTVSFWARVNSTSTTEQLIDLNGTDYIQSVSGAITANSFGTETVYVDGKTGTAITANKWHYITVTTTGGLTGSAIKIGQVSTNYGQASIDEMKFYSYARTADQIKQDYNAGLAGMATNTGSSVSVGGESPKWMTDGLVGHWKMDELSGTTVEDVSKNGNDGTLTNAQESGTSDASGNTTTTMVDTDGSSLSSSDDAYNNMILYFTAACGSITSGTERTITDYTGSTRTFTVATLADTPNSCAYEVRHQTGGRFGNGLGFGGDNDYLRKAHNSTFDFNGEATFAMWINPSADGLSPSCHLGQLIGKHSTGGCSYDQWAIGYSYHTTSWYSKKIVVSFGTGSSYPFYYSNSQVSQNQWTHVAVTIRNNKIAVYINGRSDGFVNYSSKEISQTLANNVYDLMIGRTEAGYFQGEMDDVRIYNRGLSPDEVLQLAEWGPGPVGWWKMDDNVSGNLQTIVDSSGNGNNGTTNWGANASGMDCTQQGKYGGTCKFDNVDDYVNVADSDSLDAGGSLTLEAWVNFDEYSDYETYIFKYDSYFLGKRQDVNKFYFNVYSPGQSWSAYTINTDELSSGDEGEWFHLAGVFDQAAGKSRLYINGILDKEQSVSAKGIAKNSNDVQMGHATGWSSSWYANSSLDDVRVYNYARTSKQIIEDMNAGHPIGGSPVGSSIAHWKFDEGNGGTAYDSSINGNNGNLGIGSSAPTWTNSGKFGKALSFDGSNDYVDTTDMSTVELSDVTLSFWAKVSNTTEDHGFIYKGTHSTNQPLMIWFDDTAGSADKGSGNTNCISVLTFDGSTQHWVATPTNSINDTNWHYVGVVINPTNKKIEVYIDGILSESNTKTWNGIQNTSTAIRFGNSNPANSAVALSGMMDEVKIYNSALTPDQIAIDMNQGKSLVLGGQTANNNGTAVTGAAAEYCVPGDTSPCNPPVGEWKFDEGAGGTVKDTSGNGNDGTWSGTGSHWTVDGYANNAGSFNGSDDYVWVPPIGSLTTNFSFSAWVKRTVGGVWHSVYSNGSTGDYWRVAISSDNKLNFVKNGGTDSYSTDTIPLNQWTYITVIKNGDSDTNLSFYINGKPSGTASVGAISNAPATNAYVGARNDQLYKFNGSIDQVSVFNYARSAAQIAWDYNRGKPVGWWKMDEGQGDKAYDSSGNGNTGTLTSMDPATDWVDGKFAKALDFDGSDDRVEDTNTSHFNFGTGSFSVGFWVKFGANATTMFPVSKGQEAYATAGYRFMFMGTGNQHLYFYAGDGINNVESDVGDLSAIKSNWNHYFATFEGTTKQAKVYLNGVYKNQQTNASIGSIDNNYKFTVGARSNGSYNFQGQIDDVRIYNYALTAEQVRQVMNEGSAVRFGE
ncbi:MAG: DUF2341 domain-containing protein [Candidatus Moranbacteria bacterium]|nr:DUF2341 domain-containing protein [Candidatus Moranbacteria bacterium]